MKLKIKAMRSADRIREIVNSKRERNDTSSEYFTEKDKDGVVWTIRLSDHPENPQRSTDRFISLLVDFGNGINYNTRYNNGVGYIELDDDCDDSTNMQSLEDYLSKYDLIN
jgi:hypothetical protein